MSILEELKNRVLLFDGATGTMLQQAGLKYRCPEELLISRPDAIADLHKAYATAGADILKTNTFGANRAKLKEHGLENRLCEINQKAVQLAKQAGKYVAASVGPTGKFLKPIGEISFDEALDIFREQIKAQAEAGADIILIETMQDVHEAKAATIAAKEYGLPVIVSFTFEKNLRTLTGTSPEGVATIFETLADVIGLNCGARLKDAEEIVRQYATSTNKPILSQPNFPPNEKTSNEEYLQTLEACIEAGANIIGGCCGTNPEIIKSLSELISKKQPKPRTRSFPVRIASRSQVLLFDGTTKIIGERINPTGKEWLKTALREKDYSRITEEAQQQCEAGAHALDINLHGEDEKENMEEVVTDMTRNLDIPLLIDSTEPKTIEAALKAYPGKAVINSVNLTTIDKIIPLAKKYGAAVVALAMDEKGIPEKAEERVGVFDQISRISGLDKTEILADCLVLALGAEQKKAFETINAVKAAKEKGYTTVLGVSNVSFKMPNRELLNSAFLSMAVAAGLDAAIINPSNESILGALYSSLALTGRDKDCADYIARFGKKQEQTATTLEEKIRLAVTKGEKDKINSHVEEALKQYQPFEVINNLLIPAITEVGDKFEKGSLYLPQLMLSAETMQKAIDRAKQELKPGEQVYKGKIVLATVEGDLHDIGKSIVKIVLEINGYNVIDLGKNVKAERIIEELKESKAEYLGLSALLTTTAERMREVICLAREQGIEPKVLVGGAAVSDRFAEEIGAYAYCKTPFDALKKLK